MEEGVFSVLLLDAVELNRIAGPTSCNLHAATACAMASTSSFEGLIELA